MSRQGWVGQKIDDIYLRTAPVPVEFSLYLARLAPKCLLALVDRDGDGHRDMQDGEGRADDPGLKIMVVLGKSGFEVYPLFAKPILTVCLLLDRTKNPAVDCGCPVDFRSAATGQSKRLPEKGDCYMGRSEAVAVRYLDFFEFCDDSDCWE